MGAIDVKLWELTQGYRQFAIEGSGSHRLFSNAQETTLWPLERGQYLVELKSTKGDLVDSFKFEVR